MEGAAVAHVAHLHRIRVGEVRGISNIVTNRDTKSWRLKVRDRCAEELLRGYEATQAPRPQALSP